MQKVESSSLFSRFRRKPRYRRGFLIYTPAAEVSCGPRCRLRGPDGAPSRSARPGGHRRPRPGQPSAQRAADRGGQRDRRLSTVDIEHRIRLAELRTGASQRGARRCDLASRPGAEGHVAQCGGVVKRFVAPLQGVDALQPPRLRRTPHGGDVRASDDHRAVGGRGLVVRVGDGAELAGNALVDDRGRFSAAVTSRPARRDGS